MSGQFRARLFDTLSPAGTLICVCGPWRYADNLEAPPFLPPNVISQIAVSSLPVLNNANLAVSRQLLCVNPFSPALILSNISLLTLKLSFGRVLVLVEQSFDLIGATQGLQGHENT